MCGYRIISRVVRPRGQIFGRFLEATGFLEPCTPAAVDSPTVPLVLSGLFHFNESSRCRSNWSPRPAPCSFTDCGGAQRRRFDALSCQVESFAEDGCRAIVADALDPSAIKKCGLANKAANYYSRAHFYREGRPAKIDGGFAATNRLRKEGTDNLLTAARAAGVRRFVAQSFPIRRQRFAIPSRRSDISNLRSCPKRS